MRFVKEKRGKKKEKFVLKIESSNSVTIATWIAQSEEKGENGSIEREIMGMARKERSRRSVVSSRSGRKIQEAWNRLDAQLKGNLQGRLAVKVFAAGCAQASSN